MPQGAVGWRLMEILVAGWRGVLEQIWNYEISLVFSHVVLKKLLGVHRARWVWFASSCGWTSG